MKPSIYKIDVACPGSLFIMPKPSSEWLDDDISEYSFMGINKIISLLEKAEAAEIGLSEENIICEKHGILFSQLPTPDRGLPEVECFNALVSEVADDLEKGLNVTVHCRAGIGRAGVLASCILIGRGISPSQAVLQVGQARGVNVPDTDEQLDFIHKFRLK